MTDTRTCSREDVFVLVRLIPFSLSFSVSLGEATNVWSMTSRRTCIRRGGVFALVRLVPFSLGIPC